MGNRFAKRYHPKPDGPVVKHTVIATSYKQNPLPLWQGRTCEFAWHKPLPGAWVPCCGRGGTGWPRFLPEYQQGPQDEYPYPGPPVMPDRNRNNQ